MNFYTRRADVLLRCFFCYLRAGLKKRGYSHFRSVLRAAAESFLGGRRAAQGVRNSLRINCAGAVFSKCAFKIGRGKKASRKTIVGTQRAPVLLEKPGRRL